MSLVRRVVTLALVVVMFAVAAWLVFRSRSAPDAGRSRDDMPATPPTPGTPPRLATAPASARRSAKEGDATSAPAEAPTATAARERAIRVHVVSRADQSDVADATVFESSFYGAEDGLVLGTTDEHGRLDAVAKRVDASGIVGLVARRRGFARGGGMSFRPNEEITIQLDAGAPIRGRVVSAPDDTPVVGARVMAAATDHFNEHLTLDATTGSDGTFRLEDAPIKSGMHLLARAEGRTCARLENAFAGDDDLVLRFPEGGMLEGLVTDERGRPVPHVVVFLKKPEDGLPPVSMDGLTCRDGEDSATTDSSGRYEIAGVPLGEPRVGVAAPKPTLLARSEPATFSRVGERVRRDVQVPASGSLRVVVEGLPQEESPWGVLQYESIHLLLGANEHWSGHSWEFADLTPGRWRLDLSNEGPNRTRDIDITSGATIEVRVVLPSRPR